MGGRRPLRLKLKLPPSEGRSKVLRRNESTAAKHFHFVFCVNVNSYVDLKYKLNYHLIQTIYRIVVTTIIYIYI